MPHIDGTYSEEEMQAERHAMVASAWGITPQDIRDAVERLSPKKEPVNLYDEPVAPYFQHRMYMGRGRRIRAFIRAIDGKNIRGNPKLTYGKLMKAVETHSGRSKFGSSFRSIRQEFSQLPYRTRVAVDQVFTEIPTDYQMKYSSSAVDPMLNVILADLAYQIRHDLHEACFALNDPDLYYPGVDDDIAPVTDDHVDLVIWGTQRELLRETRNGLPAVPLAELPRRIQRAFAERRRLRYQQWGIGEQQWKQNTWSLWEIPEDPEWYPYWLGEEA